MIHYTLLPEIEIRKLKREYRMRLFIFTLFFVSCAVLAGIAALLPSFIFSYTQEKEALTRFIALEKNRKDRGIDKVNAELIADNQAIQTLLSQKENLVYSKVIIQIIGLKAPGLTINSFDINTDSKNATSTVTVLLKGKATTRDTLVAFKTNLESSPLISNVELPVLDLVKSKDISYSIKFSLIPII